MNDRKEPTQRMTAQRHLVYDIISGSEEHLDAESIFRLARSRGHEISLATIYRALSFLKENGFIRQHHLGEVHGHFEVSQNEPHYHFACDRCGQVVEFEAPQVGAAVRKLAKGAGFRVNEVHLLVSGLCGRCSRLAEQEGPDRNTNIEDKSIE